MDGEQQLAIIGSKLSTVWAFNGTTTIVLDDSRHSEHFSPGMRICFVDSSGRKRAEVDAVIVGSIDSKHGYVTIKNQYEYKYQNTRSLLTLVPGISMGDSIYTLGQRRYRPSATGNMRRATQAEMRTRRAWFRELVAKNPGITVDQALCRAPEDIATLCYKYFAGLLLEARRELRGAK